MDWERWIHPLRLSMTKRHAHIQHVDVHTEDTYEHKKGKFDTPAGVCGTVGPCTSGADKKKNVCGTLKCNAYVHTDVHKYV